MSDQRELRSEFDFWDIIWSMSGRSRTEIITNNVHPGLATPVYSSRKMLPNDSKQTRNAP